MELPLGQKLGETLDVESVDFQALFPKLFDLGLTGYSVTDVMTSNGVEEAILLFDAGKIKYVEYTQFGTGKRFSGDDALPLVMNSCSSRGVFELYRLGDDEIASAESANKNKRLTQIPTIKDVMALIPESFKAPEFEEADVKKAIKAQIGKSEGIDKNILMKKYGISAPDERRVDDLLKDLGV
jgi:hypothetical protein